MKPEIEFVESTSSGEILKFYVKKHKALELLMNIKLKQCNALIKLMKIILLPQWLFCLPAVVRHIQLLYGC